MQGLLEGLAAGYGFAAGAGAPPTGTGAAYIQLLGITLVNPLTVVYFAALVLGRDNGGDFPLVDRVVFVLGAAAASLSWQTLLALPGSLLHGRPGSSSVPWREDAIRPRGKRR